MMSAEIWNAVTCSSCMLHVYYWYYVVNDAELAILQAMITYKSWLYRTLETLIFFVPSLFFNIPVQKQLVSVELCDSYLSDPVSAVSDIQWIVVFIFIVLLSQVLLIV